MYRPEIILGEIEVFTTTDRSYLPEELADMAINKIISIGPNIPAPIREQAEAFRERIKDVMIHYMYEAQKCARQTVATRLAKHGYATLAAAVERETL